MREVIDFGGDKVGLEGMDHGHLMMPVIASSNSSTSSRSSNYSDSEIEEEEDNSEIENFPIDQEPHTAPVIISEEEQGISLAIQEATARDSQNETLEDNGGEEESAEIEDDRIRSLSSFHTMEDAEKFLKESSTVTVMSVPPQKENDASSDLLVKMKAKIPSSDPLRRINIASCPLCNVFIYTSEELRAHFDTEGHRRAIQALRSNPLKQPCIGRFMGRSPRHLRSTLAWITRPMTKQERVIQRKLMQPLLVCGKTEDMANFIRQHKIFHKDDHNKQPKTENVAEEEEEVNGEHPFSFENSTTLDETEEPHDENTLRPQTEMNMGNSNSGQRAMGRYWFPWEKMKTINSETGQSEVISKESLNEFMQKLTLNNGVLSHSPAELKREYS